MRIPARPTLFLPALLLAYLLLPTYSAQAAEKRLMGDVTVPEGETVEEVHTGWGDVLIEGNVKNDVESGFGNIWIEGPVGGDVDLGSGEAHINAPVSGNVDVGHGDVYLENKAQVNGDISHHNGRLYLYPDAIVGGPQKTGMASDLDDAWHLTALLGTIGWIVMTVGLVAAAVLLTVVVPRPLRASARSLEVAPGRSLILGLGSAPVAIVGSVLLAITGVGVLLLLLLWPAYLAFILFGALVVAYFLGRKIVLATGRYRAGDALAAAVGAFLISATWLIPVLGGLVFTAFALLGTGAAILALFTRLPSGTPRTTYTSYEDYLRDRRDARS